MHRNFFYHTLGEARQFRDFIARKKSEKKAFLILSFFYAIVFFPLSVCHDLMCVKLNLDTLLFTKNMDKFYQNYAVLASQVNELSNFRDHLGNTLIIYQNQMVFLPVAREHAKPLLIPNAQLFFERFLQSKKKYKIDEGVFGLTGPQSLSQFNKKWGFVFLELKREELVVLPPSVQFFQMHFVIPDELLSQDLDAQNECFEVLWSFYLKKAEHSQFFCALEQHVFRQHVAPNARKKSKISKI